MATLIDTNVFVALRNQADALHKRSLSILESLDQVATTDYVFDELMNVLTRRRDRRTAREVGSWLMRSEVEMHPVSRDDFYVAWILFIQYPKLSFTDATNIAVMRSLGIKRIATFDEAFKQIPGIDVIS